jgi:hypothetical protein
VAKNAVFTDTNVTGSVFNEERRAPVPATRVAAPNADKKGRTPLVADTDRDGN